MSFTRTTAALTADSVRAASGFAVLKFPTGLVETDHRLVSEGGKG
jgi:hypothetical protein